MATRKAKYTYRILFVDGTYSAEMSRTAVYAASDAASGVRCIEQCRDGEWVFFAWR